MNRKQFLRSLSVAAFALAFAPGAYCADAVDILKRASAAIGGDDLKTLVYSGTGMGASYGQAYIAAWPDPGSTTRATFASSTTRTRLSAKK